MGEIGQRMWNTYDLQPQPSTSAQNQEAAMTSEQVSEAMVIFFTIIVLALILFVVIEVFP